MSQEPAASEENESRIYGISSSEEKTHGRRQKDSSTPPRTGKGSPRVDRVDSGDYDDHMVGSLYSPEDVCKGCGFPRKSSVWCPITQRHHGTDELMPATGHRRGSGGGNAGLRFLKGVFNKVSPQHNSARHNTSGGNTPIESGIVRGAGLPPVSPSHQPPPNQAAAEDAGQPKASSGNGDDNDGLAEGAGEENVQYVQGSDGYYYAYTPGAEEGVQGGEAENNEGDPVPEGGEGEAEVQYYCYTDENGETFYYAAELHESVSQHQMNHSGARSASNTNPQQTEAGHGGGGAEDHHQVEAHESTSTSNYVYEVKDEEGNTVQYVLPGPTITPAKGTGDEDADTAATQVGSPPETEIENLKSAATTKKKTFGDVITGIFKPKPKKSKKNKDAVTHVDPNSKTKEGETSVADTTLGSTVEVAEGGSAVVEVGGADGDGEVSPEELERLRTVDAAVTSFVDSLDSSEKKKFDKERKRLVKELEATEKKEREHLVKQRKVFTEDLARERRAGVFVMQSEEKTIRRGAAKGEPL